MNKFNKYRYFGIWFLSFILLGLFSCNNSAGLTMDAEEEDNSDNNTEDTDEDTDDNLGINLDKNLMGTDTGCKYMNAITESLNLKVEGTTGLAEETKLANVEVYFPLSSGVINGDDIKYSNILVGFSLHAYPSDNNPDRRKNAERCGGLIKIGGHNYDPYGDTQWRFFTEEEAKDLKKCYNINPKFEIIIKNYKSKDCSYEVIYNK